MTTWVKNHCNEWLDLGKSYRLFVGKTSQKNKPWAIKVRFAGADGCELVDYFETEELAQDALDNLVRGMVNGFLI